MAEGVKKMRAREEFIHFAEDFLHTKFGKLSSVQQSYALANFYVREIHNRLRSEISEEDLQLAVVDASNDLGCDLVHRDDGHVLVLQVKYRSEGAKEPPESITHFQTLLKRVGDPSIKGNERLLENGRRCPKTNSDCEQPSIGCRKNLLSECAMIATKKQMLT